MPSSVQTPNRVPLYAFLGANSISMVGNVLANIAIPWFVLETTGSAALTGLAAFFSILPAVIAGFFGGVLVDRLGYKRTSIISDLASGLTIALIPLFFLFGWLDYSVLLVLIFLGALLDAPGTTARSALVPDVAGLAQMKLERASASMQAVQRGSLLVGAPLAGVLVAVLGTHNVLWLDAASFVISSALVFLAVPSAAPRPKQSQAQSAYFGELMVGLRFIAREPLIRAIVITIMITNFLDSQLFSVIMPVYSKSTYESAVNLGLISPPLAQARSSARSYLPPSVIGCPGARPSSAGLSWSGCRSGFWRRFHLFQSRWWLSLSPVLPPVQSIRFLRPSNTSECRRICEGESSERSPRARTSRCRLGYWRRVSRSNGWGSRRRSCCLPPATWRRLSACSSIQASTTWTASPGQAHRKRSGSKHSAR